GTGTGDPTKYAPNGKRYVVLVGDEALTITKEGDRRTGVWAEDGILAGITQEDLDAQTGTGPDAKKYAIFLIDDTPGSNKGKAVTTPDIATYGVMNETVAKHEVILRKVSWADVPLVGARFRIFRYDLTEYTEGQEPGKNYYESTASGVYFVGKFPEGKYYLIETKVPDGVPDVNLGKVFLLTISSGGVKEKELGRDYITKTVIMKEGSDTVPKTFTMDKVEGGVTTKVADIEAFKAWAKVNAKPG
ncbi:MAG: hypothetical protein J6Y90_03240, partial [Lachnospiraceae bacterium]|nr:hypothetical protein [Lachnospiraceae bacterium]